MDGAHALLVAILVLDGVQVALACAAAAHGARRRRRDEPELAAYSFGHARLLAAGGILLAVPVVAGLAGALAPRTALWIVVVAEIAGIVAASRAHERIRPSPGATASAAAPASSAASE